MKKELKKKILDTKWSRLEAEGMTRPATPEENARRIREARRGA